MSDIDLTGTWKIIEDTENVGVASRWFLEIQNDVKDVEIPHFWLKTAATTAFYYKNFTLSPKDKRCILRFEQAAVYAVVWINGKLVGDHFGASTSFEYDISGFAKAGAENLLCVKISKVSETKDFALMAGGDPIPAEQMPLGLPWVRYPFAGLTGNVSITTGERALINALEVTTDPCNSYISLKTSFNNPRNHVTKIKIFIRNTKQEVSSIEREIKVEKENGNVTLQFRLKDLKWWSPEEPNLYALEVRLDGSNSLTTNFGFKKFDCKQGNFYLNDSIIKIQGIAYTHHKNANIKKDLETIKELGFNAVRTGGAPFNKNALDICDKLGLLVFQEFPIYDEQSGKMGLEAIKEIAPEIVCESANHPSLAAWVLGSDNGRLILENGAKLLSRIDTLESCHPAISNINNVYIDNDQNFKHGHEKVFEATGKIMGVTDGNIIPYSSHKLALRIFGGVPFSLFLSHYGIAEDSDFIVTDPFFGDVWLQDNYKQFADDIKRNGKVLLSIKNHQLLDSKHIEKMKDIPFVNELNELAMSGFDQNMQALISSQVISGYFIEEWADYKNDLYGIINEARESKGIEEQFKNINASTRLLISGLERVVAKNESISFMLSMLNSKRLAEVSVSVELLDKKHNSLSKQSKKYSAKLALATLGDLSIKAPKETGSYTLKLDLINNGVSIHTIEEHIEVIEAADIKNALSQSEFLDTAENSKEIIKMINGKKPVLFTAAISSWAESSILESVANAVKGGKILFVSDLVPEDIKLFNSSEVFGFSLEYFYSSGSAGTSVHYIPKNSPFKSELFGKYVLDKTCSAIVPSLSMQELKDAQSFVHSISIKNDEVQTGSDLQIVDFGEGKIIFSTLNFEGLETYALTDSMFAKILELVLK